MVHLTDIIYHLVVANPHLEALQKQVAKAPTGPGVYKWLSQKGDVLYIGKAKNLRSRLKSYVTKPDKSLGPWKLALSEKIADLDITTTNTELDALILETNLIKENKPKYNVLMKDDKNYVYVRISLQDKYPGVSIVRRMEPDGAKYFGPYLSAYHTRELLDLLQRVINYRETEEALRALNTGREQDLKKLESKTSVAYQIGQSCGVAIGKIDKNEYDSRINCLIEFFKGKHGEVKKRAQQLMQDYAAAKRFEEAAKLRDCLKTIGRMSAKQVVSDTSGDNTDALGLSMGTDKAQLVVLQERGGKVIGEFSNQVKGAADTAAETLEQFIAQYYDTQSELPDLIVVAEDLPGATLLSKWLTEKRDKKVEVLKPTRGKKLDLLKLAQKNAEHKFQQAQAKWESAAKNIVDALAELKDELKLEAEPKRIEGYDISHLGGTETVGSMVVMKNGKPANKEYRNFTIQSVKTGEVDDYKSLQEVLRRRLRYLAADLKQEEAELKKSGLIFGKAKKNEQSTIEDIIEKNPKEIHPCTIDYKDMVVVRKKSEIVGFARLFVHKGDIKELKTLWVKKEFRGKRLGHFIVKKILQKHSKDKIYITIPPVLESYYSEVGFRHVISPPKILLEEMEAAKKQGYECEIAMMSLPSERKTDASLSTKPDLIMIDGGKGQLSSVVAVLKEFKLEIPVVGLAKREEEIFIPGSKVSVDFKKDSSGRFLLMRLRDEAHRFANRHREKRLTSKTFHSALDDVPGIGPKLKKELLAKFGDIASIKNASDSELLKVVNAGQLKALRQMD